MLKNIIVGSIIFAAGAVTGVAASRGYFKKLYEEELLNGQREAFEKYVEETNKYISNSEVLFENGEKPKPLYEASMTANKIADVVIATEYKKHKTRIQDPEKLTEIGKAAKEDNEADIHIVTKAEFERDNDPYDRLMWTYWAGNDVVSDEGDDDVPMFENYVGHAFKKIFEANPKNKVVYIRNDEQRCYYEIEKVEESYDYSDAEE